MRIFSPNPLISIQKPSRYVLGTLRTTYPCGCLKVLPVESPGRRMLAILSRPPCPLQANLASCRLDPRPLQLCLLGLPIDRRPVRLARVVGIPVLLLPEAERAVQVQRVPHRQRELFPADVQVAMFHVL